MILRGQNTDVTFTNDVAASYWINNVALTDCVALTDDVTLTNDVAFTNNMARCY